MPGVMPRALDDRVFGRSGLVLLAWFIIVCVSPVLAHYPESDKQLSAPDQGTVQSIKRTKLQAGDLLVTVERFSAKKNRINLAIIGDGLSAGGTRIALPTHSP